MGLVEREQKARNVREGSKEVEEFTSAQHGTSLTFTVRTAVQPRTSAIHQPPGCQTVFSPSRANGRLSGTIDTFTKASLRAGSASPPPLTFSNDGERTSPDWW
ncbi:unnamed protein product, partial [Scytosiphon promiscuus]